MCIRGLLAALQRSATNHTSSFRLMPLSYLCVSLLLIIIQTTLGMFSLNLLFVFFYIPTSASISHVRRYSSG